MSEEGFSEDDLEGILDKFDVEVDEEPKEKRVRKPSPAGLELVFVTPKLKNPDYTAIAVTLTEQIGIKFTPKQVELIHTRVASGVAAEHYGSKKSALVTFIKSRKRHRMAPYSYLDDIDSTYHKIAPLDLLINILCGSMAQERKEQILSSYGLLALKNRSVEEGKQIIEIIARELYVYELPTKVPISPREDVKPIVISYNFKQATDWYKKKAKSLGEAFLEHVGEKRIFQEEQTNKYVKGLKIEEMAKLLGERPELLKRRIEAMKNEDPTSFRNSFFEDRIGITRLSSVDVMGFVLNLNGTYGVQNVRRLFAHFDVELPRKKPYEHANKVYKAFDKTFSRKQ